MKNKIKKVLGNRGTLFVDHMLNSQYSPMNFKSRFFPEESYSDLFIYCPNYYLNTFIAENNLAILLGRKYKIIHKFNFYTKKGLKFEEFYLKTSDFISSIDFPKFKVKDKFLSFTHELISDEGGSQIKEILGRNYLVSLQHRGYSIFKKMKTSLGSSVHGNFGLVQPSNISLSGAKQRKIEFCYTPAYDFEKNSEYNLVFNNPTKSILSINIVFQKNNNEFSSKKIIINPMGNDYFKVKSYGGLISFYSKLPICRALIFKNPEIRQKNFDVFHS